jgi:hypothetical protein
MIEVIVAKLGRSVTSMVLSINCDFVPFRNSTWLHVLVCIPLIEISDVVFSENTCSNL